MSSRRTHFQLFLVRKCYGPWSLQPYSGHSNQGNLGKWGVTGGVNGGKEKKKKRINPKPARPSQNYTKTAEIENLKK